MSLLPISSSRLGRSANCKDCGSGSTISFNWEYAKATRLRDYQRDLSVFAELKALRYGVLYKCRSCGQPWYLCGDPAFMNFVPMDRLPIIDRWNEHPIALPTEFTECLAAIGATPPDIYGNRSQFQETPCAVTTIDVQKIDMAVISIQRHAPFEEWRNYRLATEIASISPSPYTLSLAVRVASSKAEEVRMGFAPTLVETGDGELVVLNWTQSFFVWRNCKASDVVVSQRRFDWKNPPPVYNGAKNVVYFIADR